jgi:type II secretory pathway component PulM
MILNLVGQHDTKAATLIDNNWQVSLQSLLFELLLNHDIKAATLIDNNWQVSLQSLLFELLLNPLQKDVHTSKNILRFLKYPRVLSS